MPDATDGEGAAMTTIHVDGRPYQVEEGSNLLQACLSRELDLPNFCWHPALGSVGACRQCAVKQFEDEEAERQGRGKLVMACMTPAAEGARIAIEDEEARDFRAAVIEWLMVNHPHDCPVCDEGGECHLQDMTVMTGHTYREFRFRKRTFRNQDLGPLVHHEMNRCIQCYRCVRFYEHAGGDDLQAFACHDHTYFGRHRDGPLESPFAGNLVEVCPTGVFTDKTLKRHFTRKWDLETAPSVCVHCSLGCNTLPGGRDGRLRRIRNRYHPRVNGYFLCDRGRYGYEFTEHERRLREALEPQGLDRPSRRLDEETALRRLAEAFAAGRVAGVGSPRASVEANYALRRRVGAGAFHSGASDGESALTRRALAVLRRGGVRTPPLSEVEECDAVLVLGEDVANTAPRLALALRQAALRRPREQAWEEGIAAWNAAAVADRVQEQKGPFFVATVAATDLDRLAAATLRAAPADLVRLGAEVAGRVSAGSPAAPGGFAGKVAAALLAARRPLVVSGTGAGSEAVLAAAARLCEALAGARGEPADLVLALPECNSLGLALLEPRPLGEVLERAAAGELDTLVVVENDLYRRAPRALVDRAVAAVRHLVVIDHLAHDFAARASLLLPAAPFAEACGSLVSNEGRAQRFFRALDPPPPVRESWRWLTAAEHPAAPAWDRLDELLQEVAAGVPVLARLPECAPPASWRLNGRQVPRQPHRASGRTALQAHRSVHEEPPRPDPDSPLRSSMEGTRLQPPPELLPRYRAPGWNSVQALNRFQEEVGGVLRGGGDGRPGIRLFEPAARPPAPSPPAPEEQETRELEPPPPGRHRVVPLWHVFGSEELSSLAPGVAQLAPAPYLALAPEEAERLGLEEGESLHLDLGDGSVRRAPLRLLPGLPAGVVGAPVGLAAGEGPLPSWGSVGKGAG